ncbi:MAG TPA: hypothetical protein VD793_10475 [Gemmatimonadales bacterium]|nr:hypothetical protein [Gemmatimonadales bacterium]
MNRWTAVLFLAWPAPAAAQVVLQAGPGYVDRRLLDGAGVERQAGMMGAASIIAGGGAVAVTISGTGGKLTAKSPGTPDADFAGLTADLTLALAPWLAVLGGVGASVYVSPLGGQRWILPRLGVELRAPFASLPATAYFAGSALLGARTNADSPARGGVDVRAGFHTRPDPVGIYAEYHLERIRFAASSGRQEQRGEIRAGVRVALLQRRPAP